MINRSISATAAFMRLNKAMEGNNPYPCSTRIPASLVSWTISYQGTGKSQHGKPRQQVRRPHQDHSQIRQDTSNPVVWQGHTVGDGQMYFTTWVKGPCENSMAQSVGHHTPTSLRGSLSLEAIQLLTMAYIYTHTYVYLYVYLYLYVWTDVFMNGTQQWLEN